ncbi:MAG: DNA polymerase III subunit delta [bacterium]|nr:DNA polymerase III subunit delta [bacterium]
MRNLGYEDIIFRLDKGEIPPLYLFLGEEEADKVQVLRKLKDILFPDRGVLAFNYDVLNGEKQEADAIISICLTLPQMASKRLVVVKEADALSQPEKKKLLSYLKSPSSTTCLILWAKEWKTDAAHKAVSQSGLVVTFWPLFEDRVPAYVTKLCQAQGKDITSKAALLLAQLIGTSRQALAAEVEKLLLFIGKRKRIDVPDVEEVISPGETDSIFDLIDSVGQRATTRAIRQFAQLRDRGESQVMILFMLARHFRLLWQAKLMLAQGIPLPEVASRLKMRSKKQIARLSQQIKLFTEDQLLGVLKTLLDTDLALKSEDDKVHDLRMELLLLRLGR